MPRVSIAFASIGLGHGVLVLFWKISGLLSEPMVETQWRDGRRNSKRLAASVFSRLKTYSARRVVEGGGGNP